MNTKTLPITVQASDIEGIGNTTWWPEDNNGNTAICLDPNDGNIYMQLIMLRNILQCFGEEYKVLSYEEIEHEDGDRCEYWIYTNLPKELYEEASKDNFFRNLPQHEAGNEIVKSESEQKPTISNDISMKQAKEDMAFIKSFFSDKVFDWHGGTLPLHADFIVTKDTTTGQRLTEKYGAPYPCECRESEWTDVDYVDDKVIKMEDGREIKLDDVQPDVLHSIAVHFKAYADWYSKQGR